MPIFEYDSRYFHDATYDVEKVCIVNGRLKQRKTDASGEYSTDGTYDQYNDVELPPVKLYDLTELFGFRVDMAISRLGYSNDDYGDVKFQVSFDGGTSYYYWDVGGWAVAGASDYSTRDEVEENISTFPWASNPTLRLKVRIYSSSDQLHTPAISSFKIFFEADNNFEEDILRSLKHYVEDNVVYTKRARIGPFPFQSLTGSNMAMNKVLLISSFDLTTIQVYNVTDDPRKLNDLYFSHTQIAGSVGADQVYEITLTGYQTTGDILEVVTGSVADVYLGTDSAFYESEVPAVAIEIVENSYQRGVYTTGDEVIINYQTNKARIRTELSWKQLNVSFLTSTRGELNSLMARHSFENAIGEQGYVHLKSEGTGYRYLILDVEPYTDEDNEGTGVYRKGFNVILLGRQTSVNYREVGLVEDIKIGIEQMPTPDDIQLPDDPNYQNIIFDE